MFAPEAEDSPTEDASVHLEDKTSGSLDPEPGVAPSSQLEAGPYKACIEVDPEGYARLKLRLRSGDSVEEEVDTSVSQFSIEVIRCRAVHRSSHRRQDHPSHQPQPQVYEALQLNVPYFLLQLPPKQPAPHVSQHPARLPVSQLFPQCPALRELLTPSVAENRVVVSATQIALHLDQDSPEPSSQNPLICIPLIALSAAPLPNALQLSLSVSSVDMSAQPWQLTSLASHAEKGVTEWGYILHGQNHAGVGNPAGESKPAVARRPSVERAEKTPASDAGSEAGGEDAGPPISIDAAIEEVSLRLSGRDVDAAALLFELSRVRCCAGGASGAAELSWKQISVRLGGALTAAGSAEAGDGTGDVPGAAEDGFGLPPPQPLQHRFSGQPPSAAVAIPGIPDMLRGRRSSPRRMPRSGRVFPAGESPEGMGSAAREDFADDTPVVRGSRGREYFRERSMVLRQGIRAGSSPGSGALTWVPRPEARSQSPSVSGRDRPDSPLASGASGSGSVYHSATGGSSGGSSLSLSQRNVSLGGRSNGGSTVFLDPEEFFDVESVDFGPSSGAVAARPDVQSGLLLLRLCSPAATAAEGQPEALCCLRASSETGRDLGSHGRPAPHVSIVVGSMQLQLFMQVCSQYH